MSEKGQQAKFKPNSPMSDPQHQNTVILNLSSFDNDNNLRNTNDHHHNNNNTGMNDSNDCFMTELRELFNIFDRNRDGMISLEDFQSVLDSVGLYPSLEELQALMQHANDDNNSQASTMSSSEDGSYTTTTTAMSKQHVRNNNNNNITFSQFVTIMKAKIVSSNTIPISPEEIQNIFSVFDRDGDGFITGSELKQMTSALGMQLSDQDVQKMIHEADVDGDSMINLEEFLRYVSH